MPHPAAGARRGDLLMCTGKTHDRMSTAAYLAVTGSPATAEYAAHIPVMVLPGTGAGQLLSLATGMILCSGAGVTPDIDCANSTVARSLGFITRLFALLLTKVCGVKHRHGTHSLLGIGVFTAVAWALAYARNGIPPAPWVAWPDRVLLTLILTVILSSALCVIKIPAIRARGLWAVGIPGDTGDLVALAGAAAMVATGWGLVLLPAAVAIGCATHIAGDMLTDQGCPLLWPLTSRHYFLTWPACLRFTTGHWVERVPVTAAVLTVTVWLLLSRLGPYLPVHLPHLLEAAR